MLLYILLICVCTSMSQDSTWVVNTRQGPIRGFWSEIRNVWEFRGIPYAQTTDGDNRFKPPVSREPWRDVRNASDITVLCRQQSFRPGINIQGVEDCLVLNIFVPEVTNARELFSVLVFIHGGDFSTGNSNGYNPTLITRHGVILITLNYRLGLLGFLCMGTNDIPGNAGLLDQIAALKWIQENIQYFGGDPGAVTVYGEGTGGISVETLIISNAADGLFQRAIIESGSALEPRALSYNRLGVTKATALNSGFESVDDLAALEQFYKYYYNDDVLIQSFDYNHGLCIESKNIQSFNVINETFQTYLEKNDFIKIPILFAYANFEGISFGMNFNNIIQELEENLSFYLPHDLYFESLADKQVVTDAVRYFYFGNDTISQQSAEGYVNFLTDTIIISGLYRSVNQHASSSNTSVYVMEFAYRGGFNNPNFLFPNLIGAGHNDILAYVMDLGFFNPTTLPQDEIVRNRMTELWTNFVKYGDPTPDSSTSLPVTWTPFSVDERNYLWMGPEMELRSSAFEERLQFWEEIYEHHHLPPPFFEVTATECTPNNSFKPLILQFVLILSFYISVLMQFQNVQL